MERRKTFSARFKASVALEAPQGGRERIGIPDRFSATTKRRFTSKEFTGTLKAAMVRIAMEARDMALTGW